MRFGAFRRFGRVCLGRRLHLGRRLYLGNRRRLRLRLSFCLNGSLRGGLGCCLCGGGFGGGSFGGGRLGLASLQLFFSQTGYADRDRYVVMKPHGTR